VLSNNLPHNIINDLIQIKNCLDEYKDLGYQVPGGIPFEADKYWPVYIQAIASLEQILANNYHGHKLHVNLDAWAVEGM